MLKRTLQTTLLVVLALAPAAQAAPRAHSAAQEAAGDALDQAERLLDGRGVRTGRELSDALRELAVGLRHLRGDERERAASLLARPTDSDAPEDEAYTVPELPPVCDANFCVHSVGSGDDAPPAGQALLTLAEANRVREFENGELGWAEPPNDGDGRVDIYLKELGSQSLFGFAATDAGQSSTSQHAYLVIDDDFDPAQFGGTPALESLRITLAHEYGHVLQYGYDVTADGWHYESSAVWLEQRMYPEVNDWLRFLQDRPSGPGWSSLTEVPLTAFDHPDDQPRNAHAYGSVVLNQFLSERYGAQGDRLQRATWEHSNGLQDPSTHAYDRAIADVGGANLATEFGEFAAAIAEWRVADAPFPTPSALPDVERRGGLEMEGAPVAPQMDHLTVALYDVPRTSAPRMRLVASFPAGTAGAVALVGRTGSATGGVVTTRVAHAPDGGLAAAELDDPERFHASGGRITAVLVNADSDHFGYDGGILDWAWARDQQRVAARLTADSEAPYVASRTPSGGARRVSTRSAISATFSEAVAGVDGRSFVVRDPRGRKVRGTVSYDSATRTATFVPDRQLADSTTYTARLGGGILDLGATPLAQSDWTFTTVPRRPRASVSGFRSSLEGFRLRSRDRDRLSFTASLRQGGRTVGRKRGTIRPGRSRTLRIRGGQRGRARLVVVLTDPQGLRKRISKRVRIRR